MESWRRLAFLGLLVGIFAGGCVITSGDDDDDDDSSSSAGSGGSDDGSGGSGTSSGGSDTGGGGEGGVVPAGPCELAIADACATDWAACTGDCRTELTNTQDCLIDIVNTSGDQPTAAQQYDCAAAAAVDGVVVTTEFSDLFGCMICTEGVADECLGGFDDPIDCGAGGSGS